MSTLDQRYLLDDEAMRRFILNGYVTIRTEVPSSLFDEAYRQIHGADNRAFGNDLPGEVPALMEVLRDPVVRGVLVSILGPGYRMASESLHIEQVLPTFCASQVGMTRHTAGPRQSRSELRRQMLARSAPL